MNNQFWLQRRSLLLATAAAATLALAGCATRAPAWPRPRPSSSCTATATPPPSGRPRCGASSPTAGRANACTPSTCPTRWRATTTARPSRAAPRHREHMAYLKAEVDKVLKATGASQVVLVANSRGGNAVRNYIQNGGGDKTVSHAVLGGTPNHGVWAIQGFREGNEFSGTGPFLTALNAPKNAAGDEVTGPVQMDDHPLGQQRQVRAARRPVDRRQRHAHQRHPSGPRAQGRYQRGDAARRPPRDLVLARRVRRHLPLHHRQGATGHHHRG